MKRLALLEAAIGYSFKDTGLLEQALTHRSHSARHNERLEFLGDSVLNFTVAALLFDRFQRIDEGDLSRLRANLVKQAALAEIATRLGLSDYLRLGEGELKSGGFRRPSILADAVQIILCDHHYWGGMRQVQYLGKICQVFGMGLSMHSNSHLGISLMAMAHVAAATPHLTYACDTHYPWQSARDEVVVGGKVPIKDGCVTIPEKPGLGVDLDYDQLARGKELYRKVPYKKRDDAAEMRKHVDPEWERILPRW